MDLATLKLVGINIEEANILDGFFTPLKKLIDVVPAIFFAGAKPSLLAGLQQCEDGFKSGNMDTDTIDMIISKLTIVKVQFDKMASASSLISIFATVLAGDLSVVGAASNAAGSASSRLKAMSQFLQKLIDFLNFYKALTEFERTQDPAEETGPGAPKVFELETGPATGLVNLADLSLGYGVDERPLVGKKNKDGVVQPYKKDAESDDRYTFFRFEQHLACDRVASTCRGQKGFLLLHSVGSGKTRTALCIAMNYNSTLPITIITPPGLNTAYEEEFQKPWIRNIPGKDVLKSRIRYLEYDQLDSYLMLMSQKPLEGAEGPEAETFEKLSNAWKSTIENSIIIADEGHKLLPIIDKYQFEMINAFKSAAKVVLMTGTPMQKDWADCGNLINVLIEINKTPTGKVIAPLQSKSDQDFRNQFYHPSTLKKFGESAYALLITSHQNLHMKLVMFMGAATGIVALPAAVAGFVVPAFSTGILGAITAAGAAAVTSTVAAAGATAALISPAAAYLALGSTVSIAIITVIGITSGIKFVVDCIPQTGMTPMDMGELLTKISPYVSFNDYKALEIKHLRMAKSSREKYEIEKKLLNFPVLHVNDFEIPYDEFQLIQYNLHISKGVIPTNIECFIVDRVKMLNDIISSPSFVKHSDELELAARLRTIGNISIESLFYTTEQITEKNLSTSIFSKNIDRGKEFINNCCYIAKEFSDRAMATSPGLDEVRKSYKSALLYSPTRFLNQKYKAALQTIISARMKCLFLPIVYSNHEKSGFESFSAFLTSQNFNHIIIHKNQSIKKRGELIREAKRPYPTFFTQIINVDDIKSDMGISRPDVKLAKSRAIFDADAAYTDNDINNIIEHSMFSFETALGGKLDHESAYISDPICVLIHPELQEGLDFIFNEVMICLEPMVGLGNQEQVYGRISRGLGGGDKMIKKEEITSDDTFWAYWDAYAQYDSVDSVYNKAMRALTILKKGKSEKTALKALIDYTYGLYPLDSQEIVAHAYTLKEIFDITNPDSKEVMKKFSDFRNQLNEQVSTNPEKDLLRDLFDKKNMFRIYNVKEYNKTTGKFIFKSTSNYKPEFIEGEASAFPELPARLNKFIIQFKSTYYPTRKEFDESYAPFLWGPLSAEKWVPRLGEAFYNVVKDPGNLPFIKRVDKTQYLEAMQKGRDGQWEKSYDIMATLRYLYWCAPTFNYKYFIPYSLIRAGWNAIIPILTRPDLIKDPVGYLSKGTVDFKFPTPDFLFSEKLKIQAMEYLKLREGFLEFDNIKTLDDDGIGKLYAGEEYEGKCNKGSEFYRNEPTPCRIKDSTSLDRLDTCNKVGPSVVNAPLSTTSLQTALSDAGRTLGIPVPTPVTSEDPTASPGVNFVSNAAAGREAARANPGGIVVLNDNENSNNWGDNWNTKPSVSSISNAAAGREAARANPRGIVVLNDNTGEESRNNVGDNWGDGWNTKTSTSKLFLAHFSSFVVDGVVYDTPVENYTVPSAYTESELADLQKYAKSLASKFAKTPLGAEGLRKRKSSEYDKEDLSDEDYNYLSSEAEKYARMYENGELGDDVVKSTSYKMFRESQPNRTVTPSGYLGKKKMDGGARTLKRSTSRKGRSRAKHTLKSNSNKVGRRTKKSKRFRKQFTIKNI